ncbi:LysR family transcriptional regulator [Corynebacterium sp. sy017]|uniref:LysR family transcriptional regulator n=1 Tax=unclassified Corynebacterium TaxID=2624378 RepID=UPI001185E7F8|nr:LysR family transcriptional regulator [Corynebacterium sp. SY003]MBP3089121.1 LysR family transcriptional regulator [Corynebacterium sp. sy017]TSD91435.1 LysR family transcriptional regulator [Corynebacterium sp. SY003]
MTTPLNLEQLQTFLTVIDEGTMSAAADVLGLSQPAVSRQLSNLEKHIGQQLLIRSNKEITLTPAGALLQERARTLLSIAEGTFEELNPSSGTLAGEIRVAAAESTTFRYLVTAAHRIREKNPSVRFSIHSGGGRAVEDGLNDGSFSFGLFIEPWPLSRYHSIQIPDADEWGILVAHNSPLRTRSSIGLNELGEYPVLVPENVVTPQGLSQWLGISGNVKVCGTYNLLFNASLFVSSGNAVAICIGGLNDHRPDVHFIPFNPPILSRLHLAWPRHKLLSPTEQAFVETVQSIIKESS